MKIKKLLIRTYYGLHGDYIEFPDNHLNGKTYENVNVKLKRETRTIHGLDFTIDIVDIEGQEPIECELVARRKDVSGTLIIDICQDWG